MSVLFNGNALADFNYTARLTSAATTVAATQDTFVSVISITIEVGGAGSTVTITDGNGTPRVLVNALPTAATGTAPIIYYFGYPGIKMQNGIKIITTATAPTLDVWIQGAQ
jgi:hypothetical protein